jgi:hypothetical protein
MYQNELPLREKMTCFGTIILSPPPKVKKVNYWIFQHNQNANMQFQNQDYSNAMVRYLDNVDNRKGKLNENLSRELLNCSRLE